MFAQIINTLSDLLYSYILIVLLLGTGIYFTIRTKGVQFRMLRESIRVVMEPKDSDDGLSSFQALMVSTASTGRNGKYRRHLHRHLHRRLRAQSSGCG